MNCSGMAQSEKWIQIKFRYQSSKATQYENLENLELD